MNVASDLQSLDDLYLPHHECAMVERHEVFVTCNHCGARFNISDPHSKYLLTEGVCVRVKPGSKTPPELQTITGQTIKTK